MMESIFNNLLPCSSLSNEQHLSPLEFNALNGLLDCYEPPVPDIGSTVIINENNQHESICESPSKNLTGKRVLCSFSANAGDLDEYPFHAVTFGEPGELLGLSYNDHNYTKLGNESPKQLSESSENQLDLLAKLALAKHELASEIETQQLDSLNKFDTSGDDHSVGKINDFSLGLTPRTSHVTIIKHPFLNQNNISQSASQMHQSLPGTTCKVASANGRTILLTPTRGNIGASVQIHRVGSVNSPQVLLRSDLPSISLDGTAVNSLSGNVTTPIRCICGFCHDDGFLIQCVNCRVLQHSECMSPSPGVALPKPYYCEVCQPRLVMLAEAVNLQRKKLVTAGTNPSIAPAKTIRVASSAGFRFPTNATRLTTPNSTLQHLSAANRFILTTSATQVRPIQLRLGEIPASAVLNQSVSAAGTTTLYQVDSSALSQHHFSPRIVNIEPRPYVACTQRASKRKQDLFTLAGESSQAFDSMSNNFQFDENIRNVEENEDLPAPKFYRSASGNAVAVTTTTISSTGAVDVDVGKQQPPTKLLTTSTSYGINSAASMFPSGVPEPASEDVVIWSDSYEKANETRLSDALKQRVRNIILTSSSRDLDALQLSDSILSSFRGTQRCRVTNFEFNRKGLVATEHLYPRQPIIEYKGYAMLMDEYSQQHDFRRYFNPFVLFYKKLDKTIICLDASNYGNDGRFIRRSCTPNCEIRLIVPPTDSYSSVVNPQCIQFMITSTRLITSGAELTVPFDFDYTTCSYPVKCACSRKVCSVARWFRCGYQSLMQGGHSPGLSNHGSLSGCERDDDDLTRHHHDEFDDDDDDEEEDYDEYNHQSSLLQRSKPNLSFSEKNQGRTSMKRLLAPKRMNSGNSVFSRMPYRSKQQLIDLNSEPFRKRGRGRGRARGSSSLVRTSTTVYKNKIPGVRYLRGRPPSMGSRMISGRGGISSRSRASSRKRQVAPPTLVLRKTSLSPHPLPRAGALKHDSDEVDSSSSVYSPVDTDVTEPISVDSYIPLLTDPLRSYQNRKSSRHSNSSNVSPQHNTDDVNKKKRYWKEETRRRRRRSELSQPDLHSNSLSSVTSPQQLSKPNSSPFKVEDDEDASKEIHPKSSLSSKKLSCKLNIRISNNIDAVSLKQSDGQKGFSNTKRARRQIDLEAPGEQGDVLSLNKDNDQARVNSTIKSREETWMAEVLRRIERLEKKQKKRPSISYNEKDYSSGFQPNTTNASDLLSSPEGKASPNLSPFSTADVNHKKKWPSAVSVTEVHSPGKAKEVVKYEAEIVNEDEDGFRFKEENGEDKNRRNQSILSDGGQSHLSREDRWLNAQLRRIAEMEKMPSKLKSCLPDDKEGKPEIVYTCIDDNSCNGEHQSQVTKRLTPGKSKYRKRNNSVRGDDMSQDSNYVNPSAELWRSSTGSPFKPDSTDSPKDGELECGLIVYKRREKDPMAKFSRSRSVSYANHPAMVAGATLFQYASSTPLDSFAMVKHDDDDDEEITGGELLDDHHNNNLTLIRDELDGAFSSASHLTSAQSPPKPSKKRWLSQALMDEDFEASKLDKSMLCNSSFANQAQINYTNANPQQQHEITRQEHTSLNPKKRVMAEMAKDAAPSRISNWSTSFPSTTPSNSNNNWASTNSSLTQNARHQPMLTSKLPPKKATVKLQAEELRLQEMGKVKVSLSEYRRRRGLSVIEPPKQSHLQPPVKIVDAPIQQTMVTTACSSLTRLPANFVNILETKPSTKVLASEDLEQTQQLDEQHGPRTPSEPPDYEEEDDEGEEEEIEDLDTLSLHSNHHQSPKSTQPPPPPILPTRSHHQFSPASLNGQPHKSHSLDLTNQSKAKLFGRLPSPPGYHSNRSYSSPMSKSASEPLSPHHLSQTKTVKQMSPFTDCFADVKEDKKNTELLSTVLRRDHEIRLWQETQRSQPQNHRHHRRPHYPTYQDHQHNHQVSPFRDFESSPTQNRSHTLHLGSQNAWQQPTQARAFNRENIENVHEALRRHRDHLRAQLDTMTAAGRLSSTMTQIQSPGSDAKPILKESVPVTNGQPLPSAPMPPGLLNSAYIRDLLVPRHASSS